MYVGFEKTAEGVNALEDREIVELFWTRSERAIAESNAKYGSYCFAVADNILESKEDSMECVNDTWLRSWNVIPPKRPDKLKLFFAKITRNLSIDKIRRRTAQKRGMGNFETALNELEECISGDSFIDDALDKKLLSECIEAFLQSIAKRDRQFFLRRYFFTDAVSDIAARFGVSENAVSVSLHRTRAKLRKHLEKEGFFI